MLLLQKKTRPSKCSQRSTDIFGTSELEEHPLLPRRKKLSFVRTMWSRFVSGAILIGGYSLASLKCFDDNQRILAPKLQFETPKTSDIPLWIQNYVTWHQQMRAQFNGTRLFTDPHAPPLLIRTCLGLCGGLHDRLGQLPWDLYLANQTKRVLLIHWHRPVPLQHFLLPNQLDWEVPNGVEGFYPKRNREVRVSRKDMEIVRSIPDFFKGYNSQHPDQIFWEKQLDEALDRAKSGPYKSEKILRHQLLGHVNELVLEVRLRELGEVDMIHWTSSFGKIFWLFFRPSLPIQNELQKVNQELKLGPGQYSAVHCRVRHPKAHKGNVLGRHSQYPADKTGLPWNGETRTFAINTAIRALQCATTLLSNSQESIYFFSDSNDLVRHIAQELRDPTFVEANASGIDELALNVSLSIHIVARNMDFENTHIDLQKGRSVEAYYGTFVDLFFAIRAKCITYGVGYYALFASKISGTKCKLLYQDEVWGGSDTKRANTKQCNLLAANV